VRRPGVSIMKWSKPEASGSGGDQDEASTERLRRGSGAGMTTPFVRGLLCS